MKELTTFLAATALGVLALAFGAKKIDESRGDVYLPITSATETRVAFKSKGSRDYDMVRIALMASPRGGYVNYFRPITSEERKLIPNQ